MWAWISSRSQVVNGANDIFICSGSSVVPNPETKLYAVKIYTKFRPGIASTVEIKSIGEGDVAGLVSEYSVLRAGICLRVGHRERKNIDFVASGISDIPALVWL